MTKKKGKLPRVTVALITGHVPWIWNRNFLSDSKNGLGLYIIITIIIAG